MICPSGGGAEIDCVSTMDQRRRDCMGLFCDELDREGEEYHSFSVSCSGRSQIFRQTVQVGQPSVVIHGGGLTCHAGNSNLPSGSFDYQDGISSLPAQPPDTLRVFLLARDCLLT